MNNLTHYGQLDSEKVAEEHKIARDIVYEISNFGISERQRWFIMYLLSLELENIDDLKAMTEFIRSRKGDVVFLTGKGDEDGPTNQ
jgi:hypothetical protein